MPRSAREPDIHQCAGCDTNAPIATPLEDLRAQGWWDHYLPDGTIVCGSCVLEALEEAKL